MRIGFLADVHGNSWALDAVLAHAADRSIDDWVNLGDCVYGPLDPGGTATRLCALDALTVRGNQDRILVEPPEGAGEIANFEFVRRALADGDLEWLASLPTTAATDDVFLCHGTPRSDEDPLLEEIREGGVLLRDSESIEGLLPGISAPVVACGHTHVARQDQLPGGVLVINPGSVGLPAYTDNHPYPHAMESGTPHARYAVLENRLAGSVDCWTVEQFSVVYDWETAASAAERNGRPDWARWIRTGRA